MKIRPVGVNFFQADERTTMMKLTVAFRNFPNAPKNSLHLLTPWSRVLLEKLTGSAASQEITRIFGIRRFLTILTSAHLLSLS